MAPHAPSGARADHGSQANARTRSHHEHHAQHPHPAATALARAGIGAGLSTPAMALTPVGGTTLSSGPVKPIVQWDHAAWKTCYSTTYAQWREDGASPRTAQTAADFTCGTQP